MNSYSLSHLTDGALLQALSSLIAQDQSTTAPLLAHMAEVDDRQLYLSQGHSSMYAYCVEGLGLSEDAAYKRIHASRCARRFPQIFDLIAEGRLHLSGVVLLAAHMNRGNADALLDESVGKREAEIEIMLARRFPSTEMLPLVEKVVAVPDPQLAPGQVEVSTATSSSPVVARERVAPVISTIAPIAKERFALHVTIDQSTHDLLRHAQDLLGHRFPNGNLADVLSRVVQVGVRQLEKQKFATTDRPAAGRATHRSRSIPAEVKRLVAQRDGGRCTFVGDGGRRCGTRRRLEFDHIEPVARGGRSTVENLRLRCRAHNQYEAERVFGDEFMSRMRGEASTSRRSTAG